MSPELTALSDLYEFVRAGKLPRVTLTYDAPATKTLADALARLSALEDKAAALEMVVAFYAEPATWLKVPPSTLAAADKGAKARQALIAYQGT